MANDPNPALRIELEAALDVLEPQIRGMHDLVAPGVSITDELREAIKAQIVVRERRRSLIDNVIVELNAVVSARDALDADGYPLLPQATVIPSLVSELGGELDDLEAAAAVFESETAAVMSIDLGAVVDKPTAPTTGA